MLLNNYTNTIRHSGTHNYQHLHASWPSWLSEVRGQFLQLLTGSFVVLQLLDHGLHLVYQYSRWSLAGQPRPVTLSINIAGWLQQRWLWDGLEVVQYPL